MKKKVMGMMVKQFMNEFSSEMSEQNQTKAENDIASKMKKLLGEDWATLPITGPYMMISVLIMNLTLTQYGITPKRISEEAISKGKEYGLDKKFSEIMESAKSAALTTGEITSEKISEMLEYTGERGKEMTEHLKSVLGYSANSAKELVDKGFDKSKGILKSLKDQLKNDETDTNHTNDR